MRIAVWHNLPSGGGKRALYDHVRGLVARGHTVEAWCPPTRVADFLPLTDLVPEHVVGMRWPIPWQRSDDFQLTLRIDRQIDAMDEHSRRCAAEIDAGGFDVVFVNTCMLFRTTAIGRFLRTPSVLYLQEPMRALFEAQPRLPWLARPRGSFSPSRPSTWRRAFSALREVRENQVRAREEVDNAAAFRRILVNSIFSRESLLRAYGLDSEVCYLGIDTDHFQDRGLPRENLVVGLGSINREKNVRLAIEALSLMRGQRPRLAWIGNFAVPAYLEEMQRLAASSGVEFEPIVMASEDVLLDKLNRASAMIYAPRLEPFGLAPLEANACGTPVVAVAEGGMRETVEDGVTGLLVPNEASALAGALDRLFGDPAEARRLGQEARRAVVEKWSLAAATDRIEAKLMQHAGLAAAKAASPAR